MEEKKSWLDFTIKIHNNGFPARACAVKGSKTHALNVSHPDINPHVSLIIPIDPPNHQSIVRANTMIKTHDKNFNATLLFQHRKKEKRNF